MVSDLDISIKQWYLNLHHGVLDCQNGSRGFGLLDLDP